MITESFVESLIKLAKESDAGMASVIFRRDEGDDKCEALFYINGKGAMDRIYAIEAALDDVSDRWDDEDETEHDAVGCPPNCDCGCPWCGCGTVEVE